MPNINHTLSGLRTIREFLRVPASELAKLVGVTPISFSRYETGERPIRFDKVVVIARRLDVPIDWLVTEPDMDRREILFKRGEIRRTALASGQNPDSEERVAATLADWDKPIETTMTRAQPTPPAEKPVSTDPRLDLPSEDDPDWQAYLKSWEEPES